MWHTLAEADRAMGSHVAAALATPALESLFLFASAVGRGGMIWLALSAVAWFTTPTKRRAIWRVALSIGLTALMVDAIVKPIVHRDRPFTGHADAIVIGDRPDTASFPSGHAANAAAGATALARVWPAATLPLWTFALIVALSRVALGVHFPLDVLGGLIIGYALARFVCARAPKHDIPLTQPLDRVVQSSKVML